MTLRIGYIGLGALGRHLAGSLLRAGFPLTVYDVDASCSVDLGKAGATCAASIAETARASDTIITCLPSPEAVASVVAEEGGVLEALAPGGTWIDMSTNDAHELQRLSSLAAAKGIETLEAPVTGGVHRAAAGMITVLVGGKPEVFEKHREAFDAMGGRVFYIGELGEASVIKVITNMLAFIHLVADGEALMLAKKGGIDLKLAWDVIKASSGNSFVHETEGQLILSGSYNINFTMDLARKDLYFAHQMGREFGVPLELGGLTEQIFARARAMYGGGAQSPMVVKMLEEAVGTDFRARRASPRSSIACVFMPVPSQLEHLLAHVDADEAHRRGVDLEQVVDLVVGEQRHLGALGRDLGPGDKIARISLCVSRVKAPSPMRVGTQPRSSYALSPSRPPKPAATD